MSVSGLLSGGAYSNLALNAASLTASGALSSTSLYTGAITCGVITATPPIGRAPINNAFRRSNWLAVPEPVAVAVPVWDQGQDIPVTNPILVFAPTQSDSNGGGHLSIGTAGQLDIVVTAPSTVLVEVNLSFVTDSSDPACVAFALVRDVDDGFTCPIVCATANTGGIGDVIHNLNATYMETTIAASTPLAPRIVAIGAAMAIKLVQSSISVNLMHVTTA